MPMSQNIPSVKRFRAKKSVYHELGLKEGIRDIDSLYFQDDSLDIIVDNVDERCKIVETKTWLDVYKRQSICFFIRCLPCGIICSHEYSCLRGGQPESGFLCQFQIGL